MCNPSCIAFVRAELQGAEVSGKSVLEVGALDVNGSVRPVVETLNPSSYLGVDIELGLGVDELCDVNRLVERFGENRFDIVIATELVEHLRDWRAGFTNMKRVLLPGGVMLITTRSRGFPIHGYPWDYWRYEPADMEEIFADFEVLAIQRDPEAPGVFIKVRKPNDLATTNGLEDIRLFSVIARRRIRRLGRWADLALMPTKIMRLIQPARNKLALRTRLSRLRNRGTV